MNSIINDDELRQATGYKTNGDMVRKLKEQGVHIFTGKGGKPFTTRECFMVAAGISVSQDSSPEQQDDDII